MRQIKANVYEDSIVVDPYYYESSMATIPKPDEIVEIHFSFSQDWNGYTKVIGFWDRHHEECEPQMLRDDNVCVLPADVLKDFIFYVKVYGKYGQSLRTTEKRAIIFRGR